MALRSRIHVTAALSLRMSRRYIVNMRLGEPVLGMDVCGKQKIRQLCLELSPGSSNHSLNMTITANKNTFC
jgi:hypothetical protein